jgi:hypothetical protein
MGKSPESKEKDSSSRRRACPEGLSASEGVGVMKAEDKIAFQFEIRCRLALCQALA